MGKNIFNSIKLPAVDTNRFDLSHDVKLSFQMGKLIPSCVMDCIPGDIFNLSVENMLRFAPMISPVMHKVKVTTHYFFCPTRILWNLWDKWITGDSDAVAPYVHLAIGTDIEIGSLADYMGIPTGTLTAAIDVSVLQIAAYLLIYDEYYRDQNLQTPASIEVLPGENSDFLVWFAKSTGAPLRRAWQHDYFTSALPFAQKGDAVTLPLTTSGQLVVQTQLTGFPGTMRDAVTGAATTTGNIAQITGTGIVTQTGPGNINSIYDPNDSLVVDVNAEAASINTLRRAFKLQEWLERNARAGTRYVESILAHFGVRSSDARLNRPEYIGGAKQNMVISEVLATAQNDTDTIPVGQMAGHGISVGGGNRFSYKCEEHGFIIGIVSVMPETAYQQGIHRQFSRLDRLDYAWPVFANIGEQEVLQKELYAETTTPNATFGYVPRYAEYKFMNSRVAGEMRGTLNFWHLGRIFATDPALNELFIACDPSTRIFAVTDPDEDHIFAHIFNNISAVRKLPRYGIPSI